MRCDPALCVFAMQSRTSDPAVPRLTELLGKVQTLKGCVGFHQPMRAGLLILQCMLCLRSQPIQHPNTPPTRLVAERLEFMGAATADYILSRVLDQGARIRTLIDLSNVGWTCAPAVVATMCS